MIMIKTESVSPEIASQEADYSVCIVDRVKNPFCIVIFGGSGDLTKRKVIPSLYSLYKNGLLPDHFFILGAARSQFKDNEYREQLEEWVRKTFKDNFDKDKWNDFSERIFYHRLQYDSIEDNKGLKNALSDFEIRLHTGRNRIFYIATPPQLYEDVIENLGTSHLSEQSGGFARIIVEKPFGSDLSSAQELNRVLLDHFKEDQIFRIDHYLGKETVQDILMFRFANSIFEPLWNRNYIDHVQITAAEELGVEHRAGFYDRAGVLRDMFQNHMLQLLALIAMEPPAYFDSERVRDEKVKVFRTLRLLDSNYISEYVVLGQYTEGEIRGQRVKAYRDEEGIDTKSNTPSYAALKVFIDNWRWRGVPFYLRSGKRLTRKFTEIAVQFKKVPHFIFHEFLTDISPNILSFKIQPEEAITLTFHTKVSGSKVCLREVKMDFKYKDFYSGLFLDAYEMVLMDCLMGDHILFVRKDGVELTWSFITPVLEKIASTKGYPLCKYRSGTAGPPDADKLIQRDGRNWRPL